MFQDRQRGLFIFVIFLIFPLISNAQGEEAKIETVPKIVAVQSRTYHLTDEITFQSGYLPMDSFTKYVAIGGSFTHFFSDFFGWEIVNANYALNISTGLEQELNTEFDQAVPKETAQFDVLNYYASSNAVFTPLYTKNLLFDDTIVYGELSFVGGLGVSKFREAGFVPSLNMGAFFRFLIGNHTSLKFDVREHIYLTGVTKQNLMLMVGLSYNFGSLDEAAPQN